MLRSVFSSTLD